ncbi:MAG: hypothetical protein KA807_05710 [Prolixibacteraceae bacterium]|nr:hypothetical protein [Prolixibacteraceae bacterium]
MKRNSFILIYSFLVLFLHSCEADADFHSSRNEALIVDHNCCNIFNVPVADILKAKQKLVIAYGHTSHGSQIVSGMSGLDGFMVKNGYDAGTFDFNSDGSGGALKFYDSPFSGAEDLGNPDRTSWADATRNYLNNHSEVNVIMWSWCGQAGWASREEIQTYLDLMNKLEEDYPDVVFVYMTGHLDGSGIEGDLNRNNNIIRKFCTDNKKVLFDFADIESYDPDGKVNYMELNCTDNCDYTDLSGNSKNWATDWQDSHVENKDWYYCDAAHSQPLNGNRKAMAAWWMFASIAGWEDVDTTLSSKLIDNSEFNWSVIGNLLKFDFCQKENVNSIEIFDIQGRRLLSENINNRYSDSYLLPLENISNIEKSSILLFKIETDRGIHSGKFNVINR